MQAETFEQDVKNLAEKLSSLDSLEAHAAINKYFDTNATFDSSSLRVTGVTRIKKQIDLFNHAFTDSQVIGEPKYDKETQTIKYAFRRTIQSPHIPYITSVPLASRLSSARTTVNYDVVLHLNRDGQKGDHGEVVVTKIDIERREKVPFENAVPWHVLRPLISPVANLIASLTSIIFAHPLTPHGVLNMTTQGVSEFAGYIYSTIAREKEKRIPAGQAWSDHANIPPFASRALNSATELGKNLEESARASGIPVDQYKTLAHNTAETLIHNAQEGMEYVQGGEAKVHDLMRQASGGIRSFAHQKKEGIDEYLGQESQRAKDVATEAKVIAGQMADSVDQKKGEVEGYVADAGMEGMGLVYAGKTRLEAEAAEGKRVEADENEKKGTVDSTVKQDAITLQDIEATNILGNRKGYKNDVPRTPRGGLDSSTSNEYPFRNGDNKTSEDQDDIPKTPLGGHDPTAPNAFSFADSVKRSNAGRADSQSSNEASTKTFGNDDAPASNTDPSARAGNGDDQEEEEDIPRTPFGGHDPTASNAFSFADSVKHADGMEGHNEAQNEAQGGSVGSDNPTAPATPSANERQAGSKNKYDSVPTTPLGGHDPTAPNAFSFADAVMESSPNGVKRAGSYTLGARVVKKGQNAA